MIELRWKENKGILNSWDFATKWTLQYRYEQRSMDSSVVPGSDYPSGKWSDWVDVPYISAPPDQ